MQLSEAYQYIIQSERRKRLMLTFTQPLTAKHLSRRTGIKIDACSSLLWELGVYQLVFCLNPAARRSRLFWLTGLGLSCQDKLSRELNTPQCARNFPVVDWKTYGWVCFSQREAVLKALGNPLQPAAIKRAARFQDPTIRMSANNVRDIINLFLHRGIVEKVMAKGKAHPRYELTELGRKCQFLIRRSEGSP